MKYCFKCGTELADDNAYCHKCGACQYVESQGQQGQSTAHNQPEQKQYKHQKTFEIINKVLLIYNCSQFALVVVLALFFLAMTLVIPDPTAWPATITFWFLTIPLAWMLPMTVHYFKKTKACKPTTLTYKICTLLFVNLLAGIFMLCFEPSAENTTNNNGGTI